MSVEVVNFARGYPRLAFYDFVTLCVVDSCGQQQY